MRVHTERRLAIACGLGPSLEANATHLREHRDRLFVLAPFRVAMRLVDQGVIPDVVVLMEPGQLQYDLISHRLTRSFVQTLCDHDTPLLAHIRAPRSLVEKLRNRLRVFYFGDRCVPESMILGNSTDSLSATATLAIELGFKQIGLVGVDSPAGVFHVPHLTADSLVEFHGIEFWDFGKGEEKYGWNKASLLHVVQDSPKDSCRISGRSSYAALQKAEKTIRDEAKSLRIALAQISSVSAQAGLLVRERPRLTVADSERLRELESIAEIDWRLDPLKRRAIEELKASYLSAFWDSAVQTPLDSERSDRAVRQKGVLFFSELAERLHGN